jgi:hypothetical protein
MSCPLGFKASDGVPNPHLNSHSNGKELPTASGGARLSAERGTNASGVCGTLGIFWYTIIGPLRQSWPLAIFAVTISLFVFVNVGHSVLLACQPSDAAFLTLWTRHDHLQVTQVDDTPSDFSGWLSEQQHALVSTPPLSRLSSSASHGEHLGFVATVLSFVHPHDAPQWIHVSVKKHSSNETFRVLAWRTHHVEDEMQVEHIATFDDLSPSSVQWFGLERDASKWDPTDIAPGVAIVVNPARGLIHFRGNLTSASMSQRKHRMVWDLHLAVGAVHSFPPQFEPRKWRVWPTCLPQQQAQVGYVQWADTSSFGTVVADSTEDAAVGCRWWAELHWLRDFEDQIGPFQQTHSSDQIDNEPKCADGGAGSKHKSSMWGALYDSSMSLELGAHDDEQDALDSGHCQWSPPPVSSESVAKSTAGTASLSSSAPSETSPSSHSTDAATASPTTTGTTTPTTTTRTMTTTQSFFLTSGDGTLRVWLSHRVAGNSSIWDRLVRTSNTDVTLLFSATKQEQHHLNGGVHVGMINVFTGLDVELSLYGGSTDGAVRHIAIGDSCIRQHLTHQGSSQDSDECVALDMTTDNYSVTVLCRTDCSDTMVRACSVRYRKSAVDTAPGEVVVNANMYVLHANDGT